MYVCLCVLLCSDWVVIGWWLGSNEIERPVVERTCGELDWIEYDWIGFYWTLLTSAISSLSLYAELFID